MSNVEFGEEGGDSSSSSAYASQQLIMRTEPKTPTGVRILKKMHLAKNETQAYAVMIVISVISILATVFIYAHFVFNANLLFWQKPKPAIIPPDIFNQLPPEIQRQIQAQQQK
jgi:hypothetical protein